MAAPKYSVAELRAAIRSQPIVGSNEAARLLGIAAPNLRRLRAQGRLPKPIAVGGSSVVYIRSEILEVAKTLKRERREREAEKRKARKARG